MKIEATAHDIRHLLDLVEMDQRAAESAAEANGTAREQAARRVPRRLLECYELLLEIDRTPVIAAIERETCSGCHVRLPTMLESRARCSIAVYRCPHCKRMLYAPQLVRDGSQPARGSARRLAPDARRS